MDEQKRHDSNGFEKALMWQNPSKLNHKNIVRRE
jgi:hypothetical protein